MKQSLVTKKKRKVRLFRARYPDVDIRLLYRRDYLHLVFKYGLDSAPPSGSELVPTRHSGPPLVTRLTDRNRSTSG